MITADGKLVIKRFHASQVGQIAGSISFGVGSTAPTVNDKRLQYEVIRVPIVSVNVDPNSDRVVFRANLPTGLIKSVYEIGLWSSAAIQAEGYNLNVLGSLPVSWVNGTLTNSNARANTNALQIDYVASGTTNATLTGFSANLSTFQDIDSVVVGYYVTNNLSSLRIRLGTDASNYYEFLLPAHTANSYNVARMTRSAATVTGTPNWSAISYIAVRPSATAGGSGSVFFDGIRFEPNTIAVNNSLLVARTVLGTPHVVDTSVASDVEYSLKVNFT